MKLPGVVAVAPLLICGAVGCANTTAEVCTDGRDNDADGLIDCDDPDCEASEACGSGDASVLWTITVAGETMSCADVGAGSVDLIVDSAPFATATCDDGQLLVPDLEPGTHSFEATLIDEDIDVLGAATPVEALVVAGDVTTVNLEFALGDDPPPDCDTILVHKVYTSGGQDASGFTHDFIVLHNMAPVATPLDGWTLQFHNGPTPWTSVDLAAQNPALEIAAGGYLLVRLGTSGQIGAQLPAPDVVGPQLDISATSLVVAVMHDDALLPQDSCPDNASDLFGTKGAGCSEGGAEFGGPGFDQAFVRAGCTDTQVNSADFSSAAAGPVENSATAADVCASCE